MAGLEVYQSTSEFINSGDSRVLTSESMSYTLRNVRIGAKDPNVVQSRFVTFEADPGKTVNKFVVARVAADPLI